MFLRIRTRIAVIASVIVLTAGSLLAFGSGHALAVTGGQYCGGDACINAWGGGPWVNVETSMGAAPNDEFYIGHLNNGNTYVEFVGGGQWSGWCVGDAHNDPHNIFTSLEQCPTNSNSGGWGTNFKEVDSEDGFALKNIHWEGYMVPGGGNGSNFVLNGNTPYYYTYLDPTQK
jgi:hypothetical protein